MSRKRDSESVDGGESPSKKSRIDMLLTELRKVDSKMGIFAKYAPFILGMVTGPSVEPDPFGVYIEQRIVILNKYIIICGKAEANVEDANHKSTIAGLAVAIRGEVQMLIDLYEEFVGRWILKESCEPALKDYVLMLEAAEKFYNHGPVIGAAVTMGCIGSSFRLYAHLGNAMRDCLDQDLDTHVYKKWINHYISQGFQVLSGQIEMLIKELHLQPTLEETMFKKFYSQAVMQELHLLYSQVDPQNSVSPMRNAFDKGTGFNICFEFSRTCIENDANAKLLARAAELADEDSRKEYVSKQLTFEAHRRCVLPNLPPKRADVVVDHQGLEHLTTGIIDGIINFDPGFLSAILKGLHLNQIKKVGTELQFRDGCKDFLRALLEKEHQGLRIHIISDVFSGHLIRSAIPEDACPQNLSIHSNDLVFDGDLTTGFFGQLITSTEYKLRTFKSITGDDMENGLSVFIGNSMDDILCLMEANIGIVVEPDALFEKIAEHYGVSFVPLYQGLKEKQKADIQVEEIVNLQDFRKLTVVWKPKSGILYTASSWIEVQAFLLGV